VEEPLNFGGMFAQQILMAAQKICSVACCVCSLPTDDELNTELCSRYSIKIKRCFCARNYGVGWRGDTFPHILKMGTRGGWVVIVTSRPLYSRRKRLRNLLNRRSQDISEKTKIIFPYRESNPVHRPVTMSVTPPPFLYLIITLHLLQRGASRK